jgi:hypothetical protein
MLMVLLYKPLPDFQSKVFNQKKVAHLSIYIHLSMSRDRRELSDNGKRLAMEAMITGEDIGELMNQHEAQLTADGWGIPKHEEQLTADSVLEDIVAKEKMGSVLKDILGWTGEVGKYDAYGEYDETGEWDCKEVLNRLKGESFDNQHALETREIRIQVCLFVCVFYIHLIIPLLRK